MLSGWREMRCIGNLVLSYSLRSSHRSFQYCSHHIARLPWFFHHHTCAHKRHSRSKTLDQHIKHSMMVGASCILCSLRLDSLRQEVERMVERTVKHTWLSFQTHTLGYTQDSMWVCTLCIECQYLSMVCNWLKIMQARILTNNSCIGIHHWDKCNSLVLSLRTGRLPHWYSYKLALSHMLVPR